MGNELVKLDRATMMLAEAKTLDEVKHIIDIAEAARVYSKAAKMGLDAYNHAAEVKVRAERKAGEFLAKLERSKGGGDTTVNKSLRVPSEYKQVLDENGIGYMAAHRWQQINEMPEEVFEEHIADMKGERPISTGAILKKINMEKRKKRGAEELKAHSTCAVTDLQRLIDAGKKFSTILSDPPWRYSNQATRASTDNHYSTMSVDEIAALPIGDLVADNAHLHLWTTNAFIFESKQIIEAWGFEYKSCLVWVKPQMGIGNYWRVSHEFLLLGVRGRCPFLDRSKMSWVRADRTRHSSKPEEVVQAIEAVSPAPYLELFGRKTREGWTVWGNEIERTIFNEAAFEN